MLIGQIMGADCLVTKHEVQVGKIMEVLVDPGRPQVVALVVGRGKQKRQWRILKVGDILEAWNGLVWIGSREKLLKQSEVKILTDIWKNNYLVLGKKALNKSLDVFGRITDFEFDLLSGQIISFQIEKGLGWWKQKRIISGKLFIEILNKGVVFDLEGMEEKYLQKVQEIEMVVQ